MSARTGLAGLTMLALMMAGAMNAPAQAPSVMTHHMHEVTSTGQQLIGRLPANQTLQLDLVLPLRDPEGLDQFLSEVYDPNSANYRHFLTVPEFTARFGPTQKDYDAVLRFARENGLAVVGGSRDGMEVQVKGSVLAIESAFHVNMQVYRHPTESRNYFAPDREPSTNLPFALWHISGLENFSLPHPLYQKKEDYAAAHGIRPEAVVAHATTGSGPSASFLGSDMRAAYYGSGSLTGAGQNLGLLEYYGTDLADLTTYYKNIGQTNTVPITLLSTDGTSTSCLAPGCDDTEQELDITQALGMAPGLASLTVYVGSSDTAIISAMTTHSPLPTTIGCSWGWTPIDPSTLDPYFKKMAAQGQNFFAASGDSSTWSRTVTAWPADDPYVVSVGGTDLVTASAGGPWQSETAWASSGGGINVDGIAIPAWQQLSGVITSASKGSTTLRNGPDVSANANYTFYTCSNQTTCLANSYGGTSFAAPMWAGYIALVNQQLASGGSAPIGFLNPTIYAQNVTSSYTTNFHDITSGTSGSYSAVTGFDLVTGWGSPNAGLLAALTGAGSTPNFTLAAAPTAVSVVQGSNGTSTITTAVSGGFSAAVALSASGQPSGVTVSFSPTSIAAPGAGTSTVTLAVASTTATGSYPITVTGTGGGVTQTATITLTVTAAASPNFTISASPTAVSVAPGGNGSSTITTGALSGFNSAIALSASGQPAGVTVSFSPASIAAPGTGSSTATLAVAAGTSAGTYAITVTGTGGGVTHTTTINLTVTGTTPSFAVSASPTAITVTRGSSGKSTITTTTAGGFNSAITLKASGQGSSNTVSFSPSSIAAPGAGTSTMTVTVSSRATRGTRTITITATGGGITHTTTVTLTVQ